MPSCLSNTMEGASAQTAGRAGDESWLESGVNALDVMVMLRDQCKHEQCPSSPMSSPKQPIGPVNVLQHPLSIVLGLHSQILFHFLQRA